MTGVFFTADHHFGHDKIINRCHRPFQGVAAMRAGLIERWNAVVAEGDVVWVLGDFSLHPRELEVLSELNGRKRLIAGNHDAVWAGHSKAHEHFQEYLSAFESIDSFRKVRYDGVVLNLSHFPYATCPPSGRHAEYRLIDAGVPLVHGHVHDSYRTRTSESGAPMVNVGVDVWDFTPVPLDRVLRELRVAH